MDTTGKRSSPPKARRGEDDFGAMARLWGCIGQGLPTECWPWQGKVNHSGYGHVTWYRDGRVGQMAHRLVYELVVGPIPDGCHIHHRCHERACCNPFHLAVVERGQHSRIHHPGPETRCSQGHAKTPETTGKGGRCLLCLAEYERRRRATPERKEQVAAADRRRRQDAARAAELRAYKREWVARKRITDADFLERERTAAREYQRRKRLEGLGT